MNFFISILIAILVLTAQTIAQQSTCLFKECSCSYKVSQPNRIEKVNCKDLHLGASPLKQTKYAFQIELVDLSGNDLQDINFESLSELYITTLDLSNNLLKSIPTSLLRNIAKFENLYLTDNQIQQISSASFKDFDYAIKNLSLSKNKLDNSPSTDYAFKQLQNLEFLDLENNKLRHVPYLHGLNKLKILRLSNNILETLDFVLTPDTTSAFIIQTKPTVFPDYINELYLQKNQIEKINELSISNLFDLRILDLSDNQISFINRDAFKHFKKLTTLYLQNNKLTRIPSETFVKLSKLSYLDLSYQSHGTQGLRAIDKYAFDREDPQGNLDTVLLTGNKIETISNKAFCSRLNENVRHVHIKYLNIDNNPLVNANICVFRQLNMRNINDGTVHLYLNTIIKSSTGLNETEPIINCSTCDAFQYLGHYNIMLNARCSYDQRSYTRHRRAYDKTCHIGSKPVAELCVDKKEYDCYVVEEKSDSKIITFNLITIFVCLILAMF